MPLRHVRTRDFLFGEGWGLAKLPVIRHSLSHRQPTELIVIIFIYRSKLPDLTAQYTKLKIIFNEIIDRRSLYTMRQLKICYSIIIIKFKIKHHHSYIVMYRLM